MPGGVRPGHGPRSLRLSLHLNRTGAALPTWIPVWDGVFGSPRDIDSRPEARRQPDLEPARLVFIDETGASTDSRAQRASPALPLPAMTPIECRML